MISATELRAGMIVIHNGELHRAHSVVHKTPGNLRGFVQAKLRSLKSGAMNEHRFRSEDKIEKASLDTHEMQYIYSDGEGHHFMNQETYDQVRLSDEIVGDAMKYLLPGDGHRRRLLRGEPDLGRAPDDGRAEDRRDGPGDEGGHGLRLVQAGEARDGPSGHGPAVRRGGDGHPDRHPRRLLPGESGLSRAAVLRGRGPSRASPSRRRFPRRPRGREAPEATPAAGRAGPRTGHRRVPAAAPTPARSATRRTAAATGRPTRPTSPGSPGGTAAPEPPRRASARRLAAPDGRPGRGRAAPVEEDPDGDEPLTDGLYPEGSVVPAELPSLSDEQKSFWKDLGRTLKGLVVRKTDSKPASIPEEELAALFATGFPLPIEAFPKEKLRDTFDASRGRHRKHHAIDLGAPRGTPIVAVNDGTIERLGRDRRGGIVVYQRDVSGRFVYYYAHLARYVPGLRVGDEVKRGEKIGEVGSTGRASGPHLHFAIFRDVDVPEPVEGARRQPLPRLLGAHRPEVTRGPGRLPGCPRPARAAARPR